MHKKYARLGPWKVCACRHDFWQEGHRLELARCSGFYAVVPNSFADIGFSSLDLSLLSPRLCASRTRNMDQSYKTSK